MGFLCWATSPYRYEWDEADAQDPNVIGGWHRQLLAAGADGISTNTIQVEPWRTAEAEAKLARNVCDEFSTAERPRVVLGAMGTTTHLLTFMGGGDEKFQQIKAEYRLLAEALIRGGVDFLHLERCMDMQNVRAAVEAIESLPRSVPFGMTAEIAGMGTMLDGTSAEAFITFARSRSAAFVGLSGDLQWVLPAVATCPDPPDAVFLDTLWPFCSPGKFETPETFTTAMAPLADGGRIRILGIGVWPDPVFVRVLDELRR